MSAIGRTALKAYFESGDTPTEAQFIDLIDSLFTLTEDDSDDLTEGAAQLLMTADERSKLSGIETEATVDQTGAEINTLTVNNVTLSDGVTIAQNVSSFKTTYASLITAESTIALTLSGVIANSIIDYTIQKTISGNTAITFDGTGLRFVDYDNKALPATSLVITLNDTINFHFTISCKVSGLAYSDDKVIMVQIL